MSKTVGSNITVETLQALSAFLIIGVLYLFHSFFVFILFLRLRVLNRIIQTTTGKTIQNSTVLWLLVSLFIGLIAVLIAAF
jgi:hypothetical protein